MARAIPLSDMSTASLSERFTYGNPVEAFNGDGSRTFSSSDELQVTYDTVNYSQPGQNDIPA